MGRDAAQTDDGRYRLLVEAVTDYAIWVLILIVSHNLGLRASSRRGIGVRQIGPQRNFGSFVYCQLRLLRGSTPRYRPTATPITIRIDTS
jgi:hypothetical protein